MTRHAIYIEITDLNTASGHQAADRLRATLGPSASAGGVELDPEADGIQIAAASREALEAVVQAAVGGGVIHTDVARRLHEDAYEVDEQGSFEGDDRPFEMSPLLKLDDWFLGSVDPDYHDDWRSLTLKQLRDTVAATLREAVAAGTLRVDGIAGGVTIAARSEAELDGAARKLGLPGLAAAEDGEFDD